MSHRNGDAIHCMEIFRSLDCILIGHTVRVCKQAHRLQFRSIGIDFAQIGFITKQIFIVGRDLLDGLIILWADLTTFPFIH